MVILRSKTLSVKNFKEKSDAMSTRQKPAGQKPTRQKSTRQKYKYGVNLSNDRLVKSQFVKWKTHQKH